MPTPTFVLEPVYDLAFQTNFSNFEIEARTYSKNLENCSRNGDRRE